MFKVITLAATLLLIFAGLSDSALAQSERQGFAILKEAQDLRNKARSREEMEKALRKYDEAYRIFERVGSDKAKGVTLNDIGLVYDSWGQYAEAVGYYEKALAIHTETRNVKEEGVTLNNLGTAYKSWGQYARAVESYEKSLAICQKTGHAKCEGVTLNNIGMVYKSWAQYPKAMEYLEKSLAIRQKLGDAQGEAITLNNIGMLYDSLGQYAKALENYYERSLAIAQRIGDRKAEGATLNNIGRVYCSWGQYPKALEYFGKSLVIRQKLGGLQGAAISLNDVGRVYKSLGQYAKALEYHEKSYEITRKLGDVQGEAITLNDMAETYLSWGRYAKALEYHEKSYEITRKLGDVRGEAVTLNNIGKVYRSWGQYTKPLEYFEKSLAIAQKIGDTKQEGVTLDNMARVYESWGQCPKALEYYAKVLAAQKKIGVPCDGAEDSLGNVHLTMGNIQKAEPLIKKANVIVSLGRLALAKSDFSGAKVQYEKSLKGFSINGDSNGLFAGHAGLGLSDEGLNEYEKAADHFSQAISLTEEIRDSLTEAQRVNFYDAQIWHIRRITPYEGLARVLSKAGKGEESFKEAEGTKARVFVESLARRSQDAGFDIPKKVVDQNTDINNKLAALSQGLQKAYEKGSKEAIESFEKQVKELRQERDRHVSKLRSEYPLFAATKYPQPMDLQHTSLKDEEWVVEYEITEPGMCIYLVHGRKVVKCLFKPIERKEIEVLVQKFREPLEVLPGKDSISDKLKSFDLMAGKKLSDLLLGDILADLPKGAALIIVPDESLSVLPFEMLVLNSGGEVKTAGKMTQVLGTEFFGDRNPISYYQSVTALTLARTLQKKGKPAERLLVMADPVFQLKDQRAQNAKPTKIAESEKKFYSELMATMEQPSGGGLRFNRLALTGELAKTLSDEFKGKADTFTGLDASKDNLLKKTAPQMDRYGTIIFATHGYFGNKIPGILEPILCLTMIPEGTDGFLRMSEVMGLKLNADIVALTACQTGLGRNIAGEGTMGMGRAFQYAGARSVLMSLWSVEQKASVDLVQGFFKHRQTGKNKLEALRLARDEIRKAGYDHPFFWAPFILVGEVD